MYELFWSNEANNLLSQKQLLWPLLQKGCSEKKMIARFQVASEMKDQTIGIREKIERPGHQTLNAILIPL